ncbi:PduM family microcompartment protein [Companilactobacillus metriopterae]|uniref:PduM family microcompartment protein n=1 Tax=Companilactobacillus metriopterae TaxID=1909267 RepID=UPI00100A4E5B|nr:PduM family microcompartment protein [Companilactobacillus metriopterae]
MNSHESMVEMIMNLLDERSQKTLKVKFSDDCPDENEFLTYQNIEIHEVDLSFIYSLKDWNFDDDWINWIQRGVNYDINFSIYLGFSNIELIPWNLINLFPGKFFGKEKKAINTLNRRNITLSSVMNLNSDSYLYVTTKQKLTNLALEEIKKRKIILIEGPE